MLTVKEIASAADVSEHFVRKIIRRERLKPLKRIGPTSMFPEHVLAHIREAYSKSCEDKVKRGTKNLERYRGDTLATVLQEVRALQSKMNFLLSQLGPTSPQ